MNYSKNYQISLSVNDEIFFGYIIVETLEQANILFDQLATGCFCIGENICKNVIHTPQIDLEECIYNEDKIGVAQRLLRANKLGNEETPTMPTLIAPKIQFDTVDFYKEKLRDNSFGLTL